MSVKVFVGGENFEELRQSGAWADRTFVTAQ